MHAAAAARRQVERRTRDGQFPKARRFGHRRAGRLVGFDLPVQAPLRNLRYDNEGSPGTGIRTTLGASIRIALVCLADHDAMRLWRAAAETSRTFRAPSHQSHWTATPSPPAHR